MRFKLCDERPAVDTQAVLAEMDYLYDADYLDLIDAFADADND